MRYGLHGVTHIKLDLNDNSWITTFLFVVASEKNIFCLMIRVGKEYMFKH